MTLSTTVSPLLTLLAVLLTWNSLVLFDSHTHIRSQKVCASAYSEETEPTYISFVEDEVKRYFNEAPISWQNIPTPIGPRDGKNIRGATDGQGVFVVVWTELVNNAWTLNATKLENNQPLPIGVLHFGLDGHQTAPSIAFGKNVDNGQYEFSLAWTSTSSLCENAKSCILFSSTAASSVSNSSWRDPIAINPSSSTDAGESRHPELIAVSADASEVHDFLFVNWEQLGGDTLLCPDMQLSIDGFGGSTETEPEEMFELRPSTLYISAVPVMTVKVIEIFVSGQIQDQPFLKIYRSAGGGPIETTPPYHMREAYISAGGLHLPPPDTGVDAGVFTHEPTDMRTADNETVFRVSITLNQASTLPTEYYYQYWGILFPEEGVKIALGNTSELLFIDEQPFPPLQHINFSALADPDDTYEAFANIEKVNIANNEANSFKSRIYSSTCIRKSHIEYSRTDENAEWIPSQRLSTDEDQGNDNGSSGTILTSKDAKTQFLRNGRNGTLVMEAFSSSGDNVNVDIAVSRTMDGGYTFSSPQFLNASHHDAQNVSVWAETTPDIALNPTTGTLGIVWTSTLPADRRSSALDYTASECINGLSEAETTEMNDCIGTLPPDGPADCPEFHFYWDTYVNSCVGPTGCYFGELVESAQSLCEEQVPNLSDPYYEYPDCFTDCTELTAAPGTQPIQSLSPIIFFSSSDDLGKTWAAPISVLPDKEYEFNSSPGETNAWPTLVFETDIGWKLTFARFDPAIDNGPIRFFSSHSLSSNLEWSEIELTPLYGSLSASLNYDDGSLPQLGAPVPVARGLHVVSGGLPPARTILLAQGNQPLALTRQAASALVSRPTLQPIGQEWNLKLKGVAYPVKDQSFATDETSSVWVAVWTEENHFGPLSGFPYFSDLEPEQVFGRGLMCSTSTDGIEWLDEPIQIFGNVFGSNLASAQVWHRYPSLEFIDNEFVLAWTQEYYAGSGIHSQVYVATIPSTGNCSSVTSGIRLEELSSFGVETSTTMKESIRPIVSSGTDQDVLVAWEYHERNCSATETRIWGNEQLNNLTVTPDWVGGQGIVASLSLGPFEFEPQLMERRISKIELYVASSVEQIMEEFSEFSLLMWGDSANFTDEQGPPSYVPVEQATARVQDGTLLYEETGLKTNNSEPIYKATVLLRDRLVFSQNSRADQFTSVFSQNSPVDQFKSVLNLALGSINASSNDLAILLADSNGMQDGDQNTSINMMKYIGLSEGNFDFTRITELDHVSASQAHFAITLHECPSTVSLKSVNGLQGIPTTSNIIESGLVNLQGVDLAFRDNRWLLAYSSSLSRESTSSVIHLLESQDGITFTQLDVFGEPVPLLQQTYQNVDPRLEYDPFSQAWILVWSSNLNPTFDGVNQNEYAANGDPETFFNLYHTFSTNSGVSWSPPALVVSPGHSELYTDFKPQIMHHNGSAENSEIVLVWKSTYLLDGSPFQFTGTSYSVLESVAVWNADEQMYEWSSPTVIARMWYPSIKPTSQVDAAGYGADFTSIGAISKASDYSSTTWMISWDSIDVLALPYGIPETVSVEVFAQRLDTRAATSSPTSFPDDPTFTPTLATSVPTITETQSPSLSPTDAPTPSPTLAPAPVITAAQFTNDGTSIQVGFDKETNRAGIDDSIFDCLEISLQMSSEGESISHQCSWLSRTELLVLLAGNAIVEFDDTLFINEGSNIEIPSGFSFNTVDNVTIARPSEPVKPQVTIQGNDEVSVCGTLRLETSISGTGGRGLADVQWKVTPSEGELSPNITELLNQASAQKSTSLEIPGRFFTSGTSYTFNVEVENWLQGNASSPELIVDVLEEARADVRILGSSTIELRADEELDVSADIELNDDCVEGGINDDTEISYSTEWSFAPEIDLSRSGIRGVTSRRLRVGPARLQPGSYTLGVAINATVVATTASATTDPVKISGESEVQIEVSAADMVAVIRGGSSVSVGDNEDFELDASRSCNPNEIARCRPGLGLTTRDITDGKVTFDWTCERGSSGDRDECTDELEGLDTNSPKLNIPQGNLSAAESPYYFRVNVSPKGESGESTVSPEIQVNALETEPACIRPGIAIESLPSRIGGVSSGLTLRGSVSNRQNALLKWEANGEPATSFASRTTRENLEILPDRLSPGTSYKFRLTAELPCTGGNDAFAEVSFDVNAPPRSGRVSVTPSTGIAGLDVFEIEATSFEDPENDLPLEYSFELMRDPASNRVRSLADFRRSSVIRTRLPLSQDEESPLTIIVIARDSLGAESGRSVRTEVSTTRTVDIGFLSRFADILQEQRNRGSSEEDLIRTSMSLGSSVGLDFSEIADADPATLRSARKTIIESVVTTRLALVGAGGLSPRILAMQIGALLAALTGSRELNDQDLRNSTTVVRDLLQDAIQTIDEETNGEVDPFASSILPSDFALSTLDSIESVTNAFQQTEEGRLRLRRRLADQDGDSEPCSDDDACEAVDNTRAALRELTQTILRGSVPGSRPRDLPGVDVQVVVAKEVPSSLGDEENGLSTLVIPQSNRRPHDSEYKFSLPKRVLDSTGVSDDDSVNVVAVLFWFNIRELVQKGIVNASEVGAPLTEVPQIMTLEFQNESDSGVTFHPVGLDPGSPIQIWLPLDNSTRDFGDPEKEFELSCGSWAEAKSTWRRDGCEVVDSGDNFVVCECSHASDFATWQAFLDDVSDTLDSPISAVTTIALITLGIVVPTVVLVWFLLASWSRRRDHDDAEMVHKGAFLLLVKNRIHLRRQQRLFFQRLKGAEDDTPPPPATKNEETCWKKLRHHVYLMMRENSFFSIFTRFDPNYTRAQRATVFIAVIIANLFASSIAFELRTADDVSIGFLIGSIALITAVVTFPVKIIVRKLFKMTLAAEGSAMDRVAEIYRIGAYRNNILPTGGSPARKADRDMMVAFKRYFVEKYRLRMLQAAKREQEKKHKAAEMAEAKGFKAWWFRQSQWLGTLSSGLAGVIYDVFTCRISFKRWRRERRMRLAKRTMGYEAKIGNHGFVAPVTASTGEVTEAHIEEAKTKISNERAKLLEISAEAKGAWSKVPSKDPPKKEMMHRQRSTLLKVAAALSAEPETPAVRRGFCSHKMVYVSWFIIWVIFGLCFFYTAQWLSARTQRDQELQEEAESQEEANEIAEREDSLILIWIASAMIGAFSGLLVVEPLVHAFRFYMLPCCVRTCGSKESSSSDETRLQVAGAGAGAGAGTAENENETESDRKPPDGQKTDTADMSNSTRVGDGREAANAGKEEAKKKKWDDFLSDTVDQLAW